MERMEHAHSFELLEPFERPKDLSAQSLVNEIMAGEIRKASWYLAKRAIIIKSKRLDPNHGR